MALWFPFHLASRECPETLVWWNSGSGGSNSKELGQPEQLQQQVHQQQGTELGLDLAGN